jgi:hypothetical protein
VWYNLDESQRQSLWKDLHDFKERFESLKKRLDAKANEKRESYREQLDRMVADESIAYRYLNGDDPNLRLLALELLGDRCAADQAYLDDCERLAAEDPEMIIRVKALRRLGAHYTGTSNRRILTLAARLARENMEDAWFAFAAYKVFCLVAAIKCEPETPNEIMQWRVDWAIMNPFR